MAMKITFSGGQQIIEEVCEHCGEKIRDIHVSEITTKKENDPRTIAIRDDLNQQIRIKTKQQRISEVTASYIRRGLLDDDEARVAF